MLVLVLNSGSSSIKYEVREIPDDGSAPTRTLKGIIAEIGEGEVADHAQALDIIGAKVSEELEDREIDAVGHRVVHGVERFSAPALVTYEVVRAVERLAPLAPCTTPPTRRACAPSSRRDRQPREGRPHPCDLPEDSAFPVLVVPTDEEHAIAEATMELVRAERAAGRL